VGGEIGVLEGKKKEVKRMDEVGWGSTRGANRQVLRENKVMRGIAVLEDRKWGAQGLERKGRVCRGVRVGGGEERKRNEMVRVVRWKTKEKKMKKGEWRIEEFAAILPQRDFYRAFRSRVIPRFFRELQISYARNTPRRDSVRGNSARAPHHFAALRFFQFRVGAV